MHNSLQPDQEEPLATQQLQEHLNKLLHLQDSPGFQILLTTLKTQQLQEYEALLELDVTDVKTFLQREQTIGMLRERKRVIGLVSENIEAVSEELTRRQAVKNKEAKVQNEQVNQQENKTNELAQSDQYNESPTVAAELGISEQDSELLDKLDESVFTEPPAWPA